MRYNVRQPNFNRKLKREAHIAKVKGVDHEIETNDNIVLVSLTSPDGRTVAKFKFLKHEQGEGENKHDELTLVKYFIADKAYRPKEYILTELTKYFKRRKIRYINSDIL